MFELEALGDNGIINYASAINTPTVTVTQSSTYKEFDATNAVDGDLSTFSHTKSNTGESEWWQVDLGSGVYHTVRTIRISNRWCRGPDDPPACLCRLSQAKVWLFDENLQWIAGEQLGDTCGQSEIVVEFTPDPKYCEDQVATTPMDTIEAGVCRDNPTFITTWGEMCLDVAIKENKAEVCAEEATLEMYLVAQMAEPFDENGNFWQIHHFCPLACGDCVSNEADVDVEGVEPAGGGPEPTYSPTYLPSAQPVGAVTIIDSAPPVGGTIESAPPVGATIETETIASAAPETAASAAPETFETIATTTCQDDPTFISTTVTQNMGCADVAVSPNKESLCGTAATFDMSNMNPDGSLFQIHHFCPVTCGDCIPTGGTEPTYSPSYLPSAQPVAVPVMISEDSVPVTATPPLCEDHIGFIEGFPYTCPQLAIRTEEKDTFCSVMGMDEYCPKTCGICDNAGGNEPTYSPSYLPSAQPVAATVNFGHAYSAGDVCQDDITFVSNKGITCQSFVYDETVHCRAPTGYRDEDFNALRYSDYCPQTCGVCSPTGVSASSAANNEGGETKGVALGVGLTTFVFVVLIVTWLSFRDAGKSSGTLSPSPTSQFRDDAAVSESRGEYRDDVGLRKPGLDGMDDVGVTMFKTEVDEIVPKTEIV
jgi:hypothetical protein